MADTREPAKQAGPLSLRNILIAVVILVAGVAIGKFLWPGQESTGQSAQSAATSSDAKVEAVRWDMGSAFPGTLTQLGTLGVDFSKKMERLSGGKFNLVFQDPGKLVPALELFDAVSSGAVDSAWSTPGYWYGKEPALALFAAVPFGPRAAEYSAWIYHGGGEKMMQEIYAKYDIHGLICGVIAPEASGWFRKEITDTSQLAGLKMRFFGLGAKVMQQFGVDTQLIAGGDIFPALERGTIDATEFSMPAIDLNLGFYQVAKHYYMPGWHQQATFFELMVNKKKWDVLSNEHKAMIEISCRANIADGLSEGEAIQSAALIELKSKGVTIHRWDEKILNEYSAAWDKVVEEEKGNATFAKVWESLSAFRKQYKIWGDLGYLK